jgi:hypothetical protein
MKTEHVIKREDGSKVMISVVSNHDLYKDGNVVYRWDVKKQEKGKRKWVHILDTDNYSYRALSMEDRKSKRLSMYLEFVSEIEVLEAMTAHWNKMKPTSEQLANV